jgi:hypothetical protein
MYSVAREWDFPTGANSVMGYVDVELEVGRLEGDTVTDADYDNWMQRPEIGDNEKE